MEALKDVVVYKLALWNSLGDTVEKRLVHTHDGKREWTVRVSKDSRLACLCGRHFDRYQTGEGEVCEHVSEALALLDSVGWKQLRKN